MYNITIPHVCTLRCDHSSKSSNHLSWYKVIMILLTIFPMPYTTSCNWKFVSFGPLHLFQQFPHLLSSGNYWFVPSFTCSIISHLSSLAIQEFLWDLLSGVQSEITLITITVIIKYMCTYIIKYTDIYLIYI